MIMNILETKNIPRLSKFDDSVSINLVIFSEN
jgi:hypothetical protein